MARALFWFRNDLRVRDNQALAALAARADEWLPVFVLDPRLVGDAAAPSPRTRFLLDSLVRLRRALEERGIPLIVRAGTPEQVLPRLWHETAATLLCFNEDTTPFARRRDRAVERAARSAGVEVATYVDHVIFPAQDVRTQAGGLYTVFSPYCRSWWRRFREEPRRPVRVGRLPRPIPGLGAEHADASLAMATGDDGVELPAAGEDAALRRLDRFLDRGARRYRSDRDRPELDGTSRLSAHLRLGTLSVRTCFERAQQAADAEPALRDGVAAWLDQLVWREFFAAILEENPRVLRESFRREYAALPWNDDAPGFEAWCEGRTGYPLVDAGMRQLLATGWMHNRVRMIVASFLTKDLLIDWRLGERFFFERLVDGDPASNNGGWQWAASTGTDAQPYFRIFNPVTQGERFDPEGHYVRRWLPELRAVDDRYVHAPWCASRPPPGYPPPIVDHAQRRALALERFRATREAAASG